MVSDTQTSAAEITAEIPVKRKKKRVAAKYKGVRFLANKYINDVRAGRISRGRYEGPELRASEHEISQDDRVLELGAGIGVVSTVIAALCKPKALCSFDANPYLIPIVNKSFRFNKVENAECRHGIVVGDAKADSLEFNIAGHYLGSSITDRGKTIEKVQVPVFPFQKIAEEFNPTVLVIDIEGGELELMSSIDLTRIRCVIMELHPDIYGEAGVRTIFQKLDAGGLVYQTLSSFGQVVTFKRPEA